MSKKKYYLAYGSNLNITQMKCRCPDAKPVGTAIIHDYELLFKRSKTGAYLTIEPQKGSYVPVGVWKVTAEDEAKLDLYEGCPIFYYKKKIQLPVKFFDDGRTIKTTAFIYLMQERHRLAMPDSYYVHTCEEGYHDFGFDTSLILEARMKSLWMEVMGK